MESPSLETSRRVEMLAGVALLVLLVIGSVLVLRPFIASLLWAAVLAYATWPLYERLLARLRGRVTVAATVMSLLLLVAIVAPFATMAVSLADSAGDLVRGLRGALEQPLPPLPGWVTELPVVGPYLQSIWQELTHGGEDTVVRQLKQAMNELPLRDWLLKAGGALVHGVVLIAFSVLICFFFYRDGPAITARVSAIMERLAGHRAKALLEVTAGTISRVVNGILGTALAQSVLALIGFWIAGVPGFVLLGLLTFFLSIVPVGPPLAWVPVSLWLFSQGETGWAIFMFIYGLVVISGVDNIVKPYLISRGGSLPLLLVFMGVLGGVLAFGFIGVFLGPVILAVAYALLSEWIRPSPRLEATRTDPPD